jgi:carboxyl-terminal processing protease
MPSSTPFVRRSRQIAVLCVLSLSGVVSAGLLTLWAAPATAPQASDRQVTVAVTSLMRRDHISKHPLDDKISQRGFDMFLKSLDPQKLYFNQADVDEFAKRRDELDDMIKKGDVSFAYTVHKRYLERVDDRLKVIDELLKQEHDFTVEEEMITDPELAKYAKDEKESRDRWRKRIKYDLLVLKGDKTEGKAAVEKLSRRYHSFAKRMHQTDSDELLQMYLSAVTSSYDPHTSYMSPSTLVNFQIQMGLELEGIGAALQSTDGNTVVTKVIPGGAADKHGKLKVEDKVVSVGQGEEGEMVSVLDMKLDDVVKLIRGKAGTTVRLGVIPTGSNETVVYNIVRQKIELKDSEARGVILDDAKKVDGSPLKIGVIDLPSFYMDMEGAKKGNLEFKSTTRDVKKILDDFKKKNVDAVVLDLRHNGGGSLTEAINLTGLFIDKGPVVQVKDPDGRVQHYDDLEAGMAWEGPLVVLCSKFSASASEILAGAIQDYRRGLVVGDESTHGKGTVQSLQYLGPQLFMIANPPNLGALKITMQQFYRPNGDSTQKRGVLSDLVLPSMTNHIKGISEGDLEYALEFDRVPAAEFGKLAQVNEDLLVKLKAESQARREKSEDFAKLARNIEKYKEQKEKKTISLNEKEFFARRAELDADKEDEKQLEDPANKPKDEVFPRNFYNNEVLAITAEYAKSLQNSKVAKNK